MFGAEYLTDSRYGATVPTVDIRLVQFGCMLGFEIACFCSTETRYFDSSDFLEKHTQPQEEATYHPRGNIART